MSGAKYILMIAVVFGLGCRNDKASTDTASWWETAEEQDGSESGTSTDEDKPDDGTTGEEDKPEDGGYEE